MPKPARRQLYCWGARRCWRCFPRHAVSCRSGCRSLDLEGRGWLYSDRSSHTGSLFSQVWLCSSDGVGLVSCALPRVGRGGAKRHGMPELPLSPFLSRRRPRSGRHRQRRQCGHSGRLSDERPIAEGRHDRHRGVGTMLLHAGSGLVVCGSRSGGSCRRT